MRNPHEKILHKTRDELLLKVNNLIREYEANISDSIKADNGPSHAFGVLHGLDMARLSIERWVTANHHKLHLSDEELYKDE